VGFDQPVNDVFEKLLVVERGFPVTSVDDYLAAAEIRTGHEADLDVFFYVDVHLLDPVEPVARLLAFPGGPGSVIAFYLDIVNREDKKISPSICPAGGYTGA